MIKDRSYVINAIILSKLLLTNQTAKYEKNKK